MTQRFGLMWKQGTSGLIDVLARKITGEQGLAIRTTDMLVVGGPMHAVDLLTRLYARPPSDDPVVPMLQTVRQPSGLFSPRLSS